MPQVYEDADFIYEMAGWPIKRHRVVHKHRHISVRATPSDLDKLARVLGVVRSTWPDDRRRYLAERDIYRGFCFTAFGEPSMAQIFRAQAPEVVAVFFGTMNAKSHE